MPYDPLRQNLIESLQGPSAAHWLGTDDLGRDVLSRLIHGCRIAVIAAAEATALAVLLGVPLGLFIGYRGGWWDWFVMRVVEAIVSIPGIMVAIVIIAILGAGLHRAMIALGILFSTSFLRLARGVVLAEREEVYVRSARVVGASGSRILLRHIFPNIAPPLIVQITLTVGAVHARGGWTQFHRPGRAAAAGKLGHDAEHRGGVHGPELVSGHSTRHRHHHDGAVGQSARRRAARFDRPRHRRSASSPEAPVPRRPDAGAAPPRMRCAPRRKDEVLRVEGLEVMVARATAGRADHHRPVLLASPGARRSDWWASPAAARR